MSDTFDLYLYFGTCDGHINELQTCSYFIVTPIVYYQIKGRMTTCLNSDVFFIVKRVLNNIFVLTIITYFCIAIFRY